MISIAQTSHYLPDKVVMNADMEQFPAKYRDVIEKKAGITSRHHAVDECTSDLGAQAVLRLMAKSCIEPDTVEALICATSSPDRIQPATATRIQELCGLRNAFAFDINSVCSSAVYGIKVATGLLKCDLNNVVVVASEVYSKILNRNELSTFPYFGDGSGAILMTLGDGLYEIVDTVLYSDGSGADIIQVPAGGTMKPASTVSDPREFFFTMAGRQVFEFACDKGTELIQTLSARNVVKPDAIISHQANVRIINEIAARSGYPESSFFVNLDRYANTAGASVLIALDEYLAQGGDGEHIFMITFGGGLSWGGCYLRKARNRK